MDEMREVAGDAGELKGKAMRRARAALKSVRKPQVFDRNAAIKDWELVLYFSSMEKHNSPNKTQQARQIHRAAFVPLHSYLQRRNE